MAPPPAGGSEGRDRPDAQRGDLDEEQGHTLPLCPAGADPVPGPLLLVYALIDRPFILDLIPGNSFVEYLVEQGFDVYLLDWGIPSDRSRSLVRPLCVRLSCRGGQAGPQNFPQRGGQPLWGLHRGPAQRHVRGPLPRPSPQEPILYATPIDCSPEYLGYFRWITAPVVRPEWLVALFGNVPPEFVGSTPRLLKLTTDYLGACLGGGDRLSQDPSLATWIALDQWGARAFPSPARRSGR